MQPERKLLSRRLFRPNPVSSRYCWQHSGPEHCCLQWPVSRWVFCHSNRCVELVKTCPCVRYFCPQGSSNATICPVGSFCSEGAASPLICAAGFFILHRFVFLRFFRNHSPLLVSGTYTNAPGLSQCIVCSAGYACTSTNQSVCPSVRENVSSSSWTLVSGGWCEMRNAGHCVADRLDRVCRLPSGTLRQRLGHARVSAVSGRIALFEHHAGASPLLRPTILLGMNHCFVFRSQSMCLSGTYSAALQSVCSNCSAGTFAASAGLTGSVFRLLTAV